MLKAVEGTYRDGTITLDETPTDISEARVVVTFLPAAQTREEQNPWLAVCGSIPADEVDEMERAIEEGCERVDPQGW